MPADDSDPSTVITAVVVVHGMGEQRPRDTLDGFVRTALKPVEGKHDWEYYYSRPAVITGSYEARRYVARHLGSPDEPIQGDTEIFEYHWSYLMTGNKFADVIPSTLRLLLRRPSNVPDPLFGIWRIAWVVISTLVLILPALLVVGYLLSTDVPGWIVEFAISAVILIFWFGLLRLVGRLLVNRATRTFVDVARYLDTSPTSYTARRDIRGGLVDLLHELHDGRYSRIVVVAHSLGGYIAYDAITSLWAQMHGLQAAPPTERDAPDPVPLPSLDALQTAADDVLADGDVDAFQDRQFALWQDLRRQGNPWRITDLVTVGTPMALADLLITRPKLLGGFSKADRANRDAALDELERRGALVRCPPRSEKLEVESTERRPVNYRWEKSGRRELLGSQSVFAVVRWTNLWFPVIRGDLRGDWFGGPLRPLFGNGIDDVAIEGSTPERFKRGLAHSEYFAHPDKGGADDSAGHIRNALSLQTHAELRDLLDAPPPDSMTGTTGTPPS